jgi:hypothetical protein
MFLGLHRFILKFELLFLIEVEYARSNIENPRETAVFLKDKATFI